MRITENMRYQGVQRNLSSLSSQQAEAAQQALTGRRVGAPSDDPIAAAELARTRAARAQVDAQRGAIRMVRGDVEQAESALAEAGDLFTRAREIALSGANGSLGADERKMLAEEVRQLRETLTGLANQKGARGYLFAGSQTATAPFDNSGTFSGDNNDPLVDLGDGTPKAISLRGAEAFTAAGGRDVFADLTALETALTNNDSAGVSATLDGLEASRKQLGGARSNVGLLLARLETSDNILEQGELGLATREEAVAGADPFAAYSKMSALSQALERAITVSRNILDIGNLGRF